MAATVKSRENFIATVREYYRAAGRHDLPWRMPEPSGSFDPYKILVSEIMLQQTQVPRAIPKYDAFLLRFPTVQSLAAASLGDVLVAWQGLGYNRRAKFLWQAAQRVVHDFDGMVPTSQTALESLPGVGANTAGAVRAYAFGEPAVFIETNIRTAFIHHFFLGRADVADREILEVLKETLLLVGDSGSSAQEEPGSMPKSASERHDFRMSYREFYWALMDYGVHLKAHVGNASRASKTYAKQSKFDGSLRQLRGRVLRLLAQGNMPKQLLLETLADDRAEAVLQALSAEGLVRRRGASYDLP